MKQYLYFLLVMNANIVFYSTLSYLILAHLKDNHSTDSVTNNGLLYIVCKTLHTLTGKKRHVQ